MGTEYILQMKNIKKSFSGVEVLHGVDLDVRAGEVRALVGENGTGKSTLMKILGGIYDSDSGEIYINGKKTSISSAQDAQDLGVSIIHQEIVLVQDITVGENIFIGREPLTKFGFINYKEIYERSLEILASIGLKDMDPNTIVRELTISQQQMIEIAKAISTNAKIIVMDEPTSSLTDREIEFLFDQIRKLREKNVSIIYISHKMDELSQIAVTSGYCCNQSSVFFIAASSMQTPSNTSRISIFSSSSNASLKPSPLSRHTKATS